MPSIHQRPAAMRIDSLLAPGTQAMEKGQPWIVPGNQHRKPFASPTPHLESIHTLIQSTEREKALPLSPESMVNHPPHMTNTHKPTKCLKIRRSRNSSPGVDTKEQLLPYLRVPKEARRAFGGCFDPENWVFRIVWEEVRDLDLPEMLHTFYYREDRGTYGEHHTSTRGAAPFNDLSNEAERKLRGGENHRHQEQGRRVRHRCLQTESDKLISTFTLELAQKIFPSIKARIEQMHGPHKSSRNPSPDVGVCQQEGKLRNTHGAGKKLGKDDQLTAALVSQHLANILVFRLHQELDDTQEALEKARAQVAVLEHRLALQGDVAKQEQVDSTSCNNKTSFWQQQTDIFEYERLASRDEVLHLRKQLQEERLRNGLFSPPLPPLPVVNTGAKRSLNTIEETTVQTPGARDNSCERHAKRRRINLELPPIWTHHAGLPSPAPSFDGWQSSHVASSFCSSNGPNA